MWLRIVVIIVVAVVVLGFVRTWPHTDLEGVRRINSYEFLGRCWQGDVRLCDFDPFD
ncbi:hypothetical protein L0Y40_02360 [Candidatus Wolfebacteria bacterium]|nr:hypothetical protein [Candidatus Wolfebacteria bacterium]